MPGWEETLQVTTSDIEGAVTGYFPGDAEFTKTVVETVAAILETGDVHRWAELKRLDAHAAKHQRIAVDYLLNLTTMLINRLCCLAPESAKKFRDICFDRIENFHNQCRDDIPQSVSRQRARFEFLHAYNVKSYASVLTLTGTLLNKGDDAQELGKRIASNHNHWFNFCHLIEFFRSVLDGVIKDVGNAAELLCSLGPSFAAVVAGLCGIKMGTSVDCAALIDQTGVTTPVWVGSVLIELLDVARRLPAAQRNAAVAASLNALASLNLSFQAGLARTVMNRVISLLPDLIDGADGAVKEEMINFLLCAVRSVDESHLVDLEFASRLVVAHCLTGSERLKALTLKWLRVMCYGPIAAPNPSAGSLFVWRSLLGLDSPVFDFVASCMGPKDFTAESAITCVCAIELIRAMLQRDSLVRAMLGKSELVPATDLLVTPRPGLSAAPLIAVLMRGFTLRKARKACCYILHQCAVRNPAAARQVLFASAHEDERSQNVTENLARVLLDSEWESQIDLNSQLCDLERIDLEALNLTESATLLNCSTASLICLNSVLETAWLFRLETQCERADAPTNVNDRLEYWLVHDNVLALSSDIKSVYHTVSARLLALLALHESSGPFSAELLGLVETSTGIINNDLEKELVAIDALFLLLDSPPADASGTVADLEYLFALKLVAQLVDEPMNRGVTLRFIQYRWTNRFVVLKRLLQSLNDRDGAQIAVGQITHLLRVVAVEILVATQLVDTDAEHTRNMRDFGTSFLVADVARGSSLIVDAVESAFALLPVNALIPKGLDFVIPEIRDPRLDESAIDANEEIVSFSALVAFVDAVVSVLVQWSVLTTEPERYEVIPFLIESVDYGNQAPLFKQCVFTKLVPRLYAMLDTDPALLPFNLRTLRLFVSEYFRTKNHITKSGIVESLCLALMPFVASAEIWMIEQDIELARQLVDVLLGFTFDVVDSKQSPASVTLPLTLLTALVATRQGFAIVEIVKELSVDRYRHQFEKVLNSTGHAQNLLAHLVDIVKQEILFKELAI